jgi:hypothetical protein
MPFSMGDQGTTDMEEEADSVAFLDIQRAVHISILLQILFTSIFALFRIQD